MSIAVGAIIILLPILLDLFKAPIVPTAIFSSFPLWIDLVGLVVTACLISALTYWSSKLISPPETFVTIVHENRQRMLERVLTKWITGFLENRLYYGYDEKLLPLPLRKRIGSRFDLVLSDPLKATHPILPGTTITQVFDQAEGELLILGEPGAGKTTLLLELTRDLLKRAEDNPEAPIPIVLMLSSWATRKVPLEQWIVEELRAKYDIPSQIGEEWVKANQLLLLLDGLDEVALSALPACINTINEYYHQAHRSLVVCSRTKEYLDQPGRLALHTAVTFQPLSSEQVDCYLNDLAAKGEDVEGLKQTLHQSAELSTLATTPLFLTVLILAYHGKPAQELLALVKEAQTDQQHIIFRDYVERILRREGARIHAPAQKTKYWLAWLARQMTAHNQSELYLEQLQPDWLPERRRSLYHWSFGLVGGLFMGLVGGLFFGLVVGLFFGPIGRLLGGLVGGLVLGLDYGVIGGQTEQIEPKEAFSWSWRWALIGPVVWPVSGLWIGLVVGLFIGLHKGLIGGLVVGLFFGLLSGLLFLFDWKRLPKDLHFLPNEGIRRSATNGLVIGLLSGLLFGLLSGLVAGLASGLVIGLVAGLLGGQGGGLRAVAQHIVLRFWLWQERCTPPPWQYIAFLDDTVEQLLLRKVGGGYIFRHRLLQNYFASLDVVLPHDSSFHTEAPSVSQNTPNGDPSL